MPDHLIVEVINVNDLPPDWKEFNQLPLTQQRGKEWVKSLQTAVLKIPLSIINLESNYLINPVHPDFQKVKLLSAEPFILDERIKR